MMDVVITLAFAIGLGLVLMQPWGAGDDREETASPAAFNPPGAVPDNSEYVQSRILPSGDLKVEHWIRSTRGIDKLTLSVPPSPRNHGPGTKVRALHVQSDGETHVGPAALGARGNSYYFAGASSVHVSYIMSGVVVPSSSVVERALVRVTSVDLVITNDSVPKALLLTGGEVLAAACTAANRTDQPRPCGNPDGNGWRVSLSASARDDRVMAQVDLPGPPEG